MPKDNVLKIKKSLAFIKRDFHINSSYKFSFIFDFFTILFSVLTFFFIAKIFGRGASEYLINYGGDYFPFVLIGIAFYGYLHTGLTSFTQAIREEQYTGTLETILLSPTGIPTVLISGSLWNFLFTSLRILLYLIFGILFFGFDISRANLISAITTLLLTITSSSGLGIISASFIIVLKRGDPVNWLFSGISRFLGGVYFPISILPLWVQKASLLIPITHSLEAMRKALISGAPITEIWRELTILFIFSAVLLPLSILCFKLAVRMAKKSGSLLYY